ncbi:MAG: protein kinase [Planctomycetes bacterium]|nr:protein kinase [Planctomycetota bacterium]
MSDDPLLGQDCSGWTLERKIGQGGMGSVYLARRPGDDTPVVVKFLAAEQAQNPTWRGRFLREARVMEQVKHPNIVGVHAVVDDEAPYIVMEFVDGGALDEQLAAQGAFAPAEAARLARDIALGLAHAHKSNVIHRDIKPANVLLTRDGVVKILDFGLAKTVAADDGLTMAGQVLGTPHYMAPEQWGDHHVDARADVFALGATLYQLVTGSLPFPGSVPEEISNLAKDAAFAWPRELVADLPEDLEMVIVRALIPDRQYRYPDAQALADDLQRVVDGAPVEVPCLVDGHGFRHLLMPWGEFVVGSDDACGVLLQDASVAPQHAHFTRTPIGWLVRDLGAPGGTWVGSMKIAADVLLKDGDELRFGEVACTFRDGGQGARLETGPAAARPRLRVPAYLFEALLRLSDRRCVLALIEDLDRRPNAAKVEAARAALAPLFGDETAAAAAAAMEKAQRRAAARLPGTLFSMTHENLGDDLAAWLAFWEQSHSHFPDQAVPSVPVGDAALRVVKGEPEVRDVILPAAGEAFTIGRDEGCAVVVANRSVSRVHATVQRLHRRLIIRDGASRFGTLLGGERVIVALLETGDTITIGKAELVFGGAPPAVVLPSDDPEEDMVWVDPEVYLALEGLKHPSTALAATRLIALARDPGFIAESVAPLFAEADRARAADALTKVLERRAGEAAKVLAAVLGPDPGDRWQAAYEARCDELPTQVVPLSWLGGPGG